MTTIDPEGYAPTWGELMERAARKVLSGAWWMLPVEVVSFSASNNSVDLRPVVVDLDRLGAAVEIPVARSCGILWPGTGGGYSCVRQIAEGETGVALFASRSISAWLTSGSLRPPPEGDRQGALMDGVYLAGLSAFTDPPASLEGIETAGMRLGLDDGSARLEIRPDGTVVISAPASILLGSDVASAFAARADLVSAELSLIAAALGTIAAAVPVTNPYTSPGSVAATKTRIE